MHYYSQVPFRFTIYCLIIISAHVKSEFCPIDTITPNDAGYVEMSDCKLETFDVVIPNTKWLVITNAQLKEIPKVLEEYPKLTHLVLRGNAITSYPDSLALPELTNFWLDENPIGFVNISATYLPKLVHLDLSNTSLTKLPESLETFTLLEWLYLRDNNFEQENIMNTKFPPALSHLYLSGTGLTEIPLDIYNLKKLTNLELSENKLNSIMVTQKQLQFLNNLENLYLTTPSSVDNCNTTQGKQELVYNEGFDGDEQVLQVCVMEDSNKTPIITPSIIPTAAPNTNSTDTPWLFIILIIIGLLISGSILVYCKISRKHAYNKESTIEMEALEHDRTIGTLHTESTPPYSILDDKKIEILPESSTQFDIPVESTQAPMRIPMETTQQTTSPVFSSEELKTSFTTICSNLQAYRLNKNDIEDIKIIGAGGFANVWLVQYQNNQYLASKRLRTGDLSIFSSNQIDAFTKEIRMASMLKHANIVQFIGVVWDGNNQQLNLQMLFEYMEGGDLRDCLQRTGRGKMEGPVLPFEWTCTKLQIIRDIASALVYVHSFKPPILHRDLKSRNILLSANAQTAKISDFGVSRIRAQNVTSMTANVGTARWLAPEVASGSRNYNESADIYAFGMVLCELDSHDVPFAKVTNQENGPLHEQAVLVRIAMGLLNPIEAIDTLENSTRPERIYALAKKCLARDPIARPSAIDIAQEVNAILSEYE